MSKSFKSTEFWITLCGVIGGIVMAAVPESQVSNIIGAVLAAVCGSSYTLGRSMVKSSTSKAEANSIARSAIIDAVKKKT